MLRADIEAEKVLAAARLQEHTPEYKCRLCGTVFPFKPLTETEKLVLRLTAKGYTNKQVSIQLRRKEQVIKGHLTSVFSKLGVQDRTAAVVVAVKYGILKMEEI